MKLATPWAGAALAQLTVFRGGFSIEAAERVLDLREWPEASWTIDVIQELVDASLLRLDPDGVRYGMLRVVEDYAAEHLVDPQRTALEVRHGQHFATWSAARLGQLDGLQEIEARRALASELDNLLAACDRAEARADGRVAAATVCAAWEVLELVGPFRVGVDRTERVLWLAGVDPTWRARVAVAAGRARAAIGDTDAALAHLHDAVPLAREARDKTLEARASVEVAIVHRLRNEASLARSPAEMALAEGDPPTVCRALAELALGALEARQLPEALGQLERGCEIATRIGARRLFGVLRSHLGTVHDEVDAPAESATDYAAALAVAREVGDRKLEAYVLGQVGILHRRRGKLVDALHSYEASLAIHRRMGDRRFEAEFLGGTAATYQQLGRWDEAERALKDALIAVRELNAEVLERKLVNTLGALYVVRGREAEAEACFRGGLELARATGDTHDEAVLLTSLGNLARRQGRLDEALARQLEALDLHRTVGRRWSEAVSLGHLAMVFDELGRLEEARDHYLAALELHREVGNTRFAGMVLQCLGRLWSKLGDPVAAERDLADAEGVFREIGDPVMLAKTLVARAEFEVLQGRRDVARAALDEAVTLATPEQIGKLLVQVRASVDGRA